MMHLIARRAGAAAFAVALLASGGGGQGGGPPATPYRIVQGVTLAAIRPGAAQVTLAVPGPGARTVATAAYAAAPGMAVEQRLGPLTPASAVVAPDSEVVAVLPWTADMRTVTG